MYNPGGKYMVKLWWNGVPRKVVVDDRIPVDRAGKPLCSRSSDPTELWVSIIEKAYMKLHGGYDFPGSNSGVDLHALTGWIPDSLHFADAKVAAGKAVKGGVAKAREREEREWKKLHSAANFGDCLVTMATGSMPEAEADALGLVPTHAYAVLAVREACGVRLLQVKNPWSKRRWKGAYSCSDGARWTAALQGALGYDAGAALASKDNGIFWIDFDSVRRYLLHVVARHD